MRILLTLLLLLSSTPSWAAIAVVASTTAGSSNGNSVTTSAINTTGATLIVVNLAIYHDTYSAITDSAGNTWTQLTKYGSSNYNSNVMFYCLNPTTSASHTFTESNSTLYPTLSVIAFSGTPATPAIDGQNGQHGNSSTLAPGSITTTGNGDLLVVGVASNSSAATIDSSFTIPTSGTLASNTGSGHMGGGIAYYVQPTAGAINPTWTSGTASDMNASIVAVKDNGAPSQSATNGFFF